MFSLIPYNAGHGDRGRAILSSHPLPATLRLGPTWLIAIRREPRMVSAHANWAPSSGGRGSTSVDGDRSYIGTERESSLLHGDRASPVQRTPSGRPWSSTGPRVSVRATGSAKGSNAVCPSARPADTCAATADRSLVRRRDVSPGVPTDPGGAWNEDYSAHGSRNDRLTSQAPVDVLLTGSKRLSPRHWDPIRTERPPAYCRRSPTAAAAFPVPMGLATCFAVVSLLVLPSSTRTSVRTS